MRIRAAEPVPDLVEPIMAAVARERTRPAPVPRATDGGCDRDRHATAARWTLAPAVAAAVAGMVLGSVLVGGPWQSPANRPIAAATVVRNVRIVAPTLDAFQGTYVIHEFGLDPSSSRACARHAGGVPIPAAVPSGDRGPDDYPSPSWTPTDLRYIQDVTTTFTSGPSGCPGDLPPDICPRTRAAVTHLSEFSAAAPLPADLVLPISTFGSATGFQVLGEDRIGDRTRSACVCRSNERRRCSRSCGWAGPGDRSSTATASSVARRSLVAPAPDRGAPVAESRASRVGAAVRPRGRASGSADPRRPLVSVSEDRRDFDLFRIPGAEPRSGGPPRLEDLPDRIGYLPRHRRSPGALELVSIVLPTPSAPATPSSVLVYAEGLDYLKVGERRDWAGPEPFGPLDPGAQEIPLEGGGVAYYEPAGEGFGRRLAIHAADADLFLESNLSRDRLLEIASSLTVVGRPLPAAWRDRGSAGVDVERIDVAAGLAAAGLPPSLFDDLPGGYVVASTERSTTGSAIEGITFRLRQVDTDAAGEPLTLHVERDAALRPRPRPSRARSRSPISSPDGRRAEQSSNGSTAACTTRSKGSSTSGR